MGTQPHHKLIEVLRCAYLPCSYIDVRCGVCPEAKWAPADGHIPRGFLGATGKLEDVKLVMLFDKPGHPHEEEGKRYGPKARIELLRASVQHTYKCFDEEKDSFHQKAKWCIKQLYPCLSFDEQLRHIWITESRLCSNETGGSQRDPTCAKRYLLPQIKLLRPRVVLVFGVNASEALGLKNKWCHVELRSSDRHMVYGRAKIEGFDAVYCHGFQGASNAELQKCLDEVKCLVDAGGNAVDADDPRREVSAAHGGEARRPA